MGGASIFDGFDENIKQGQIAEYKGYGSFLFWTQPLIVSI